MRRVCPLWLVVLLVFLVTPEARAQTLRQRMLAAEDARVAAPAAIAPLLQGLRSPEWALVAQAVRGLGRFERPEFIVHIQPLLSVSRPEVRREAANALGQSLASARREDPLRPELALVTRALVARLRIEPDAATRGVIAETLGRLPHRTADAVTEVETALRGLLPLPDSQPPVAVRGVVRGLEFLIRGNQKLRVPDPVTRDRLRAVATFGSDPADVDLAGVRRGAWLAVLAGAATGAGTDIPLIEQGLDDPDAQVRRLATVALATVQGADSDRLRLLRRAFADASFNVRHEAVRSYSRTVRPQDCTPLIAAVDDANGHVALAALDALGEGCPAGPSPVPRLSAVIATLPAPPAAGQRAGAPAWHKPAHALVALARLNREAATPQLARFAEYPVWEVRAYAARAAAALSAGARLELLAADEHDNVRAAALAGLRQTRGHDADPFFIDALGRRDYELVLNAAQALEGSPRVDVAVPAIVAAFTRISAERRDTSRDTRMALLARLRELGSAANGAGSAAVNDAAGRTAALQPCLSDADPVVAGACAALLRDWTGRPAAAAPARPAALAPLPALLPTAARIVMAAGGTMELRLFPGEAPFTVARFAALARRGYYNGLTMHRVVPGFVLQGGSPGANEYSGDAAFMRDELGLRSNARGTLGTSTRGRDTGDAQFFVNLLDNPRLDHDFTVFAEITSGLDVMDRVLEGDAIQSVEIR